MSSSQRRGPTKATCNNNDSPGYYLGIDIGTQGLTVLLTDTDLHVVATGEAEYGFVPNPSGAATGSCYEQTTTDWENALQEATRQIGQTLRGKQHDNDYDNDDYEYEYDILSNILAIGISGQMHGEVLMDGDGQAMNPVRLWCDGRNAAEAVELTAALNTKCPQRMTAVRFLWTARHQPHRAAATHRFTTPAGWLAYRLTGQVVLGIGDAAGMFPVDSSSTGQQYNVDKLRIYNQLLQQQTGMELKQLQDLLPDIRVAGQDAGSVTQQGAQLLAGLVAPSSSSSSASLLDRLVGIPVASAEGDQVAALAGSLVGQAGTVACSFGTSVCANVVADVQKPPFVGVSPAIDHFCAADGQPIHMVWLRNGTTFFNTTVASYQQPHETTGEAFVRLMPAVVNAAPDCGGLLALPFMDDEPGLQVATGPSTAMVLGWTPDNATNAGNVIKAALLATMMNLKAGVQILQDQNVVTLQQIVLSGGLVKTPAMGQLVANVFDCHVRLLAAADEGSSWGAAVMAAYRHYCWKGTTSPKEEKEALLSWPDFLQNVASQRPTPTSFTPEPEAVQAYQRVYAKYQKLRELEGSLRDLQRDEAL